MKITSCPNSPNCVSTSSDGSNHIDPIIHNLSIEKAKLKLMKILSNERRCKLIEEEKNYLRYVFTTLLFRFKDDVEFLIESDKILMRSASRVGYSDLGVNRKRLERIRKLFNQL